MEWLKYPENKPKHDGTLFVINCKVRMLPHKAYFDEEDKEFISVEAMGVCPASVTHFAYMPELPKNENDSTK